MVGIQTITVNCSYTWLVQWKKYVSVFSSDETFCNVNELDQHQYISIYHKGNMLQYWKKNQFLHKYLHNQNDSNQCVCIEFGYIFFVFCDTCWQRNNLSILNYCFIHKHCSCRYGNIIIILNSCQVQHTFKIALLMNFSNNYFFFEFLYWLNFPKIFLLGKRDGEHMVVSAVILKISP